MKFLFFYIQIVSASYCPWDGEEEYNDDDLSSYEWCKGEYKINVIFFLKFPRVREIFCGCDLNNCNCKQLESLFSTKNLD